MVMISMALFIIKQWCVNLNLVPNDYKAGILRPTHMYMYIFVRHSFGHYFWFVQQTMHSVYRYTGHVCSVHLWCVVQHMYMYKPLVNVTFRFCNHGAIFFLLRYLIYVYNYMYMYMTVTCTSTCTCCISKTTPLHITHSAQCHNRTHLDGLTFLALTPPAAEPSFFFFPTEGRAGAGS